MTAAIKFTQLNIGWDADPNVPRPKVELLGPDLLLRFELNRDEIGMLRFVSWSRFRLGGENDHAWYSGQCRFSKLAPRWGDFYELSGVDTLRDERSDWTVGKDDEADSRHFVFYFRDDMFECIAQDWNIENLPNNALLPFRKV